MPTPVTRTGKTGPTAENVGAQARELIAVEAALIKATTGSRLGYKGGAIRLDAVLDTERKLLAVRDELARARAASSRAAATAFRALGGGWS